MRAIYILLFMLVIFSFGCSTVEVAKEFTKATNSVKNTIKIITNDQDKNVEDDVVIEDDVIDEIVRAENYKKEKEEIVIEKEKEEIVAVKQKKIASIKVLDKNLHQLVKEFGDPVLIRKDGNTQTIRFDTLSCRLFIYFDLTANMSKAQYYEIRSTSGSLVDKKENIEKCFQEISKAKLA